MSAIITKVDSSTVEDDERIVKVVVFGDKDVRTAAEYLPYGIDSRPVKGTLAAYFTTTVSGEDLITGYANGNRQVREGEIKIYSTNASGEQQNYIYITQGGEIEIGGNADNMVRYSKLETAFNKLKADHNDLVTAFNAHMHATAGTGPPSTPTPVPGSIPAVASVADITPAKIDEIKTS